MKPILIVCISVACALTAGGCSSGEGGGTAGIPFNPFGTEPVPVNGPEPTISGGDPLPGNGPATGELCDQACANIQSMCPGSAGGAACANQCRSSRVNAPPCEEEFRAYVACVARAQLVCGTSGFNAPACMNDLLALDSCSNSV